VDTILEILVVCTLYGDKNQSVHMNIQEYIWHEIKPRPEVARERVSEMKLLVDTSLHWEAVLTWVAHDFYNSIQNYWDGFLQPTMSCYFLLVIRCETLLEDLWTIWGCCLYEFMSTIITIFLSVYMYGFIPA